MKVLLVQLPVPNNKLSNLPLALGYLKASADAARIPGLQVEILERQTQDRGGDAFLLDAILERDPDLVGFSLYTWNSSRAIGLARALKQTAPEILTVGGGPEVNRDGDFVISAADALDFLVLGEGERTFVELLQALNNKATSPTPKRPFHPSSFILHPLSIPGLAYHPASSREWVFNPPRTAVEDVNLLPSVYLSGALEGFLGRFMMIELSRWCPSKCSFCYYGRQDLPLGGKRYFEVERLRQELLFGMEHGVEQVHFVEANFNTLPHLKQIYQTIKETGANRRMGFYAEMRGEAIDEEEADRLAECNFGVVECGLQSAVPEVLARVRRKNHLPRLVRGVHLLRERGIEVFLDAILGLPGDTPETFRQTLAFIEDNGLAPYDLFHLQILPGTQLKTEAQSGKHGLEWQSAPPYFALQTAELSFEQLCELRRETLERKGEDPAEIQGLPIPGPFSLTLLPKNEISGELIDQLPLERLVIDRVGLEDKPALQSLARRLASEVTIWLRLERLDEAGLKAAQEALTILSEPNPSGAWHIFVEGDRPLTEAERAELLKAIHHREGYLDRLAVFALLERDPTRFTAWPSVNLFEVVPWQPALQQMAGPKTIWKIDLKEEQTLEQWQARMEETAGAPGYGLYVRFPVEISVAKVRALLEDFEPGHRMLFLAEPNFAAGLASTENEDLTLLSFPTTLELDKTGRHSSQFSQHSIEKAALRWTVAHRLKVSSGNLTV
jgi:radical SAM superfamily enzyme YgiQ (UPF0313 family)